MLCLCDSIIKTQTRILLLQLTATISTEKCVVIVTILTDLVIASNSYNFSLSFRDAVVYTLPEKHSRGHSTVVQKFLHV